MKTVKNESLVKRKSSQKGILVSKKQNLIVEMV